MTTDPQGAGARDAAPQDRWRFHNPVSIRFGDGCRADLAHALAGQRLLLVTTARGRRQIEADPRLAPLIPGAVWVDDVTANPGLAETQATIDRLDGSTFDCVVALGGGSALDAGKALAAALTPGLGTRDLATLIAEAPAHLDRHLLPLHAIPTTSGTGSEVTPFATIWDRARRRKLSLAHPAMFPASATVDPELTRDLPPAVTLATGLDALDQALESVWNRNRSPMTLTLAGRAIGLAFSALPALHADPGDRAARSDMAQASLVAGLCISQTRTAICHAMSYPLTAHFGLPHGLACAFTMAEVARQVQAEAPDSLAAVAPLAGFADGAALVEGLGTLLATLRLHDAIAGGGYFPSGGVEPLLELRDQMFTPGRSDNFILSVSNERLGRILSASMG